MTGRVVNLYKEKPDVYCGRGSMYGNPFQIGVDGTREEVIEKSNARIDAAISKGRFLNTNPEVFTLSQQELIWLSDKTLGCFCKPKDCHADHLLKRALQAKEESEMTIQVNMRY